MVGCSASGNALSACCHAGLAVCSVRAATGMVACMGSVCGVGMLLQLKEVVQPEEVLEVLDRLVDVSGG